jgi:hypothetical protein
MAHCIINKLDVAERGSLSSLSAFAPRKGVFSPSEKRHWRSEKPQSHRDAARVDVTCAILVSFHPPWQPRFCGPSCKYELTSAPVMAADSRSFCQRPSPSWVPASPWAAPRAAKRNVLKTPRPPSSLKAGGISQNRPGPGLFLFLFLPLFLFLAANCHTAIPPARRPWQGQTNRLRLRPCFMPRPSYTPDSGGEILMTPAVILGSVIR